MSEGFVVVSRWGPKLHQVGCTCGVCKSRRKEQAKGFKQKFAGQNEHGSDTVVTPKPDVLRDEDSQLAVGAPSSDLPTGKPPDQTKAQSAELNISSAENEPDTANGISTAPAKALLDVQQPTQLKKKALKVTKPSKSKSKLIRRVRGCEVSSNIFSWHEYFAVIAIQILVTQHLACFL